MKNSAENRVLQDEIALRRALEQQYLAQAATSAAEGEMDAFSWAMDVSRTAERDAEAIETIVASRDIPAVNVETANLINLGAVRQILVGENEVAEIDYLQVLDPVPLDSTAFKHGGFHYDI